MTSKLVFPPIIIGVIFKRKTGRVVYVGNLKPGLSFYKIGNEKIIHTGKIIIE